ncbi:NAD(+) synthase [Patescibacteria group bacterium]
MEKLKNDQLKIDTKQVCEKIENYIKDLVEKKKANGVIFGLSGGIDSSVLAYLCAKVVDKKLVHAYYLYERDSSKESRRRAQLVADLLGIDLHIINIEPEMKKERIYSSFIMKINSISKTLNRALIQNLYKFMYKEVPFISTLKQGHFKRRPFKKLLYNQTVKHIQESFDARHKYRRKYLEKKAKEQNLVLLGAANFSEVLVGWYVKDGVDDLPVSPISGLYKTQIRQIAECLNMPSDIREQLPSPDMMKGITDEYAIGMLYAKIDIIHDGLERGLKDAEIVEYGVTQQEIDYFRNIHQLSAWKRQTEHEDAPVDGTIKGGFRL